MKMTYENLNLSELEQRLKSLLSESNEFIVELSLDGNGPAIVCNEVMTLINIIGLVEKQGFKVNDFTGIKSNGHMRECIGITLDKPFIHERTNESIEGLFIVGNACDGKTTNVLYSFLIRAEKPDSIHSILFSVDIVAKDIESAKISFFEKINSFKYPSKEEKISFIPVTYENGDWVEMDPEESKDEIRFGIDSLTLEKVNLEFKVYSEKYNNQFKDLNVKSLEEFVMSIFEDDSPEQKSYGYIARWSEDNPYWSLFIVCDGVEGEMLCGGDYPLNLMDKKELDNVLSLFSKQKKKVIVNTDGYFID